jgi:Lrp/AsnC family leucine-responsive transcriptional regulator
VTRIASREGAAAGTGGPAAGDNGHAPGEARRAPLWGLLEVTAPQPTEPAKLDPVDRRLLALLAADSRASQRKLARDLHMSPPAVGERIARLERLGVIRGYTVSIDWASLGYESVFLAVTAVQGADQAALLRSLRRLPEVEEIVVITGSMDMLARLRVRDHAHLRQVLLSEIWRIEGVQRTETFVALAEMPAKFGYVADLLERDDAGAAHAESAGQGGGDGDGADGGDAR